MMLIGRLQPRGCEKNSTTIKCCKFQAHYFLQQNFITPPIIPTMVPIPKPIIRRAPIGAIGIFPVAPNIPITNSVIAETAKKAATARNTFPLVLLTRQHI